MQERPRKRKNVKPPKRIRMFSVQEIAARYGFHENTIRSWVSQDGLRCVRYGPGNKIFIAERDVEDFIKKNYF